jgi:hypothetical protein
MTNGGDTRLKKCAARDRSVDPEPRQGKKQVGIRVLKQPNVVWSQSPSNFPQDHLGIRMVLVPLQDRIK